MNKRRHEAPQGEEPVSMMNKVLQVTQRIICPLLLLLLAVFPTDSAGAPVGDEFQVNTYTTGSQYSSGVAADADGDFVVVWHSDGSSGSDSNGTSIQGQRFDSAGAPVGDEFQVNTHTTGTQALSAVAADADGDFVVVWLSGGYPNPTGIQGQRFDSAGAPAGDKFQVNTYTTSYQIFPAVASDADGDFVVVWRSEGSSGSDSSDSSIQGQRFDSSGAPVGDEFQVNTYTTSYQVFPAVAADADGDFVVIWHSDGSSGSDSSLTSIQGQRFDSAGAPVGDEFQVNTYTTGGQGVFIQGGRAVAAGADGDFVVVWHSDGSSGSDSSFDSIQGQRFGVVPPGFAKSFAPDTIPAGGISRLTFAIDNTVNSVSVEGLHFDDFFPVGLGIATPSNATTTCTGGTITAMPGAGGTSYTDGAVSASSECTISVDVTSEAEDTYVNITGDLTSSAGNSGSAAATLVVDTSAAVIFSDGFESGDLTAWSSVVP